MGQEDRREAVARSAPGTAVHEQVEILGAAAHLLGCRHTPDGEPRAAVLVCTAPPLDHPVDAGRTARLGRHLARAGVAVQRFGSLDPDAPPGGAAAVGVDALVEDARGALELLRDRCPVERVGLLGVRLGALVAARLARALPAAPLALWQPATRPRAVLEEAARARAAAPGSPTLDVLGTRLGAELAEGALVGGLVDELGPEPRPPLAGGALVGGRVAGLGPERRPLLVAWAAAEGAGAAAGDVARCRARGFPVEELTVPCDGDRAGRPVPVATPDELVERTTTWFARHLLGTAAVAPAVRITSVDVGEAS